MSAVNFLLRYLFLIILFDNSMKINAYYVDTKIYTIATVRRRSYVDFTMNCVLFFIALYKRKVVEQMLRFSTLRIVAGWKLDLVCSFTLRGQNGKFLVFQMCQEKQKKNMNFYRHNRELYRTQKLITVKNYNKYLGTYHFHQMYNIIYYHCLSLI